VTDPAGAVPSERPTGRDGIRTLNEPRVADLMTRRPIVVYPDTSILEVAEILDLHDVSGVLVVDWTGYLMGVVSQMDLLRVRASETLWGQWSDLETRHVMSRPALTVAADTTVREAAQRMEELGVHRLVVVEDDGETPIGVLSATDVVRAMVHAGD
jgi:CBS domain-containing protein